MLIETTQHQASKLAMSQQTVGYRHLQPLKHANTSYVFTYGEKMYICISTTSLPLKNRLNLNADTVLPQYTRLQLEYYN
jgi:hypothetical protein